VPVEFEFAPGLSAAQKKKNVKALHDAYYEKYPGQKLLEVSTKSLDEQGAALSPFHLQKKAPSLHKSFPVENIYQASKVFEAGGPYFDLYGTSPLEAKRDERLEKSGKLLHYCFEQTLYPSYPSFLFYTWLYINALLENPGLVKGLEEYDGFTDIEFAKTARDNCQAKACAIYAALKQNNLLGKVESFEDFKALMLEEDISVIEEKKEEVPAPIKKEEPVRRKVFSIGQYIDHPSIGIGEIIKRDAKTYTIYFRVSGPKTLSREYVEKYCSPYEHSGKRV
jgi:hypothetical protein